jgi:NADPH-dependent glutamate synthase beta subunit-like oxidoreductase
MSVGNKSHSEGRLERSPDHSLMPPCQFACPLHMEIGQYVDLVAQGKIMEALQVIRDGNPFPSICAYVCTHPCEDACRRGQVDKPIAIRALKRFAVEFGGDRMIGAEAKTRHEQKVAIVGSGPAGLACAYYLRKLGYPATIFEAHTELGGMLRVGIPQYRLPREVVDTEVQRLVSMGVEIKVNTRIISLDLLFDIGYKAIFITVGAHQSLRMGIEGEESPGVIDGATFLREVNLGLKPSLGEKVAVVGGGNVAIDAARAAIRLDAKKVSILYRRTREEMPADPAEIEQAVEEGVDIVYLVAPARIKRENRRLNVTCVRMELGEPDESGRRRPTPIKDSEFNGKFDTLIAAIGQAPRTPSDFRVRLGRGSTIQVDPLTLTTNRTGVYAGGDAVTGPGTVTQALASGRQAASRIDDYLQHRYPSVERESKETLSGELSLKTIEMIKKTERVEPPSLALEARTRDFDTVELVYGWEDAINEARRCLRCGMGAEILFQDKCATCLTCLRVCPYHVPYLDEGGTILIPPDQCQACGICVAECPARAIVLRKSYDRSLSHRLLAFVANTGSLARVPCRICGGEAKLVYG